MPNLTTLDSLAVQLHVPSEETDEDVEEDVPQDDGTPLLLLVPTEPPKLLLLGGAGHAHRRSSGRSFVIMVEVDGVLAEGAVARESGG